MKRIILLICIFNFLILVQANYWDKKKLFNKGLVIIPVADAVIKSMKSYDNAKSVDELYKELPMSPEKGLYGFLRLHQLLFNEVVSVLKVEDQEVECQFPGFFYTDKFGLKHNSFWILKKNILMLKDINSYILRSIPQPFRDFENNLFLNNILTLSWPWYDCVTKRTYSAGTRFVRLAKKDNNNSYAILIFDNEKMKSLVAYVPHSLAVVNYPKDYDEALRKFVLLLKSWVYSNSGFIPYLWGGASFTKKIAKNNFSLVNKSFLNKEISIWIRPDYKNKVSTGYDCASLVLRAAQIIGMPYFCKNTSAISQTLRPLKVDEVLEEGDLIWLPGHVLVVSDIKNNKVIEQAGYSSGYGILHEIELEKVFNKVKTYSDLVNLYYQKKRLKRLCRLGEGNGRSTKFLILKMKSIWNL